MPRLLLERSLGGPTVARAELGAPTVAGAELGAPTVAGAELGAPTVRVGLSGENYSGLLLKPSPISKWH